MDDTFRLVLDGVYYPGFQDGQVSISIEDAASSFSFTIPERWRSSGVKMPFGRGSDAEVYIGETMVMKGNIDVLHLNRDRESGLILRLAGRSKVRNVVDASAIYGKGVWKNKNIFQIARDLCEAVDVDVVVDAAIAKDPIVNEPIARHGIERGEKIYECIERVARTKSVLMTSSLRGELAFIKAGTVQDEGVLSPEAYTILGTDYEESENERFSEYIFKVQVLGNDRWSGNLSRGGLAVVRDDQVKSRRPLIVLSESHGTSGNLKNRATWERNVRAGRSTKLSYDIEGWRTVQGRLWLPNRVKRVTDVELGVDQDLLVTRVTWMASRGTGRHTNVELVDKDAYDTLKPPAKRLLDDKKARVSKDVAARMRYQFEQTLGQFGTTVDTEFFSPLDPSRDAFTRKDKYDV